MASLRSLVVRIGADDKDIQKSLSGIGEQAKNLTNELARIGGKPLGEGALKSLNDLINKQRLTAEGAVQMAAGLDRIGGVSRLTASQLTGMNKALQDGLSAFKALGQEAPRDLQRVADVVSKQLKPALDNINPAGLTTRMMALGTAVGTFVGQVAYDAVKRLGGALIEITGRGITLAPIVDSFQSLARTVGQSGDAMLAVSRTATKGLISDLDLMQAANKAILLGLPVTSQEFGTLAQTAVVLGKAMGQGATQSLNDLTTALGRSSPLILDNLGLTVKIGEANEMYAATLGKSSAELTEAEKKLAFYNAAMEAARKRVEDLGGLNLTLADRVQQARVAFGNFTDALGVAIAKSPVINAAFGTMSDALSKAFGANQTVLVQRLISVVNTVGIGLADVAIMAVKAGGVMAQAWGVVVAAGSGVAVLITGIGAAFAEVVARAAGLAASLPGVGNAFSGIADNARKSADSMKAVTAQHIQNTRAALEGAKGNSDYQRTLQAIGGGLSEMRERMVAASKVQVSSAGIAASLVQTNTTLTDSVKAAGTAVKSGAVEMKDLAKQTGVSEGSLTRLKDRMQGAEAGATKFAAEQKKAAAESERFAEELTRSAAAARKNEAGFAGLRSELGPLTVNFAELARQMHITRSRIDEIEQRSHVVAFGFKGMAAGLESVGDKVNVMDTLPTRLTESASTTRRLADAFENLANISGGTFGGIVQEIGNIIGALDLATESVKQFRKASTAGDRTGQITAAAGGAGALIQATGRGNTASRIAGGAATGAALGSIIPGIGTGVGAGVGAVVGLVRGIKANNTEWVKLSRDIGRDIGVNITDELAKSMEANSKRFGRQAATLLDLDKIIASAGGLDAKNFERFAAKLHDTFSLIEQGQLSLAQGAEIVDRNWATMLAQGTDTYGFIADDLKKIIALNDRFGTQSKEIAAFQKQQGQSAIAASNAIIGGIAPQIKAWTDIKSRIDAARTALKEAKDAGDFSAFVRSTQELNAALGEQRQAADLVGRELTDLGTIALATFGAAVASGSSFAEALGQASPGLTSLSAAFNALGIEVDNVALKSLLMQNTILEKNPQLLTAIGGLGQGFAALSNLGLLTTDTFSAMQRTGVDTFTRLQAAVAAAGGSTRDALLPMQDYLQKAAAAAAKLGIPLDDTTQILIDQSKQLGLWQDAGLSAAEKQLQAFDRLIAKMDEFISVLTGMPTQHTVNIDVNTNYRTNGAPFEVPEFASTGGVVTPHGIRHFARGGRVMRFVPRGTDTIPAMLTPGEVVLTEPQQKAVKAQLGNHGVLAETVSSLQRTVVETFTTLQSVVSAAGTLGTSPNETKQTVIDQKQPTQDRSFDRLLAQMARIVTVLANIPTHGVQTPLDVPQVATGGLVTPHGIRHFAAGGRVLKFAQRGTDTVPAMLTPGEVVLTVAQQKAVKEARQNLGIQTAEHTTFESMHKTVAETFTRLQEAVAESSGATRNELRPMQDSLQRATTSTIGIQQADPSKIVIDQRTQQPAMSQDTVRPADHEQTRAINRLLATMARVITALREIPPAVDIDVQTNDRKMKTLSSFDVPEFASTGGLVTPHGIRHFASGGRVLRFAPRGTDTIPAMLTPGEVVLTKAQQKALTEGLGAPGVVVDTSKLEERVSQLSRDIVRLAAEQRSGTIEAVRDMGQTIMRRRVS